MSSKINIDKYHWHEALDRSFISLDNFNRNIRDHIVFETDEELRDISDKIGKLFTELYCKVGAKWGDKQ